MTEPLREPTPRPIALPGTSSAIRAALCDVTPCTIETLLAVEAESLEQMPAARQAQAAAARLAARSLLGPLGHGVHAFPRQRHVAPAWPIGLTGSLAHDEAVGVAAVAPLTVIDGLGIDVEPMVPLPGELAPLVLSAAERANLAGLPDRAGFAAKEAVYKATHPREGRFLEFADVVLNLNAGQASVRNGPMLAVRVHILQLPGHAPRLLALAWSSLA